jgi:glycosyltransferase involved in cell wall biosynthesis
VLELVRRLHPEMPMAVCCLDETGAWGRDLEADGIEVTALGRKPGFHPSLGRGIARAVSRHRATVIHAHHYSPFVYSALARLFRSHARIVFTEHGRLSDAGPSAKRRLANRVLGRMASRVFTVSAELKEHLIDEGFARGAIGVIYNGIDVGPPSNQDARRRSRDALAIGTDAVVVGTIARLDPVKDLGTLIRSLGELPRTLEVVLLIVGDGSERAALERIGPQCAGAIPRSP